MAEPVDLSLSELRRANVERVKRWHPGFPGGDGWSGADWSNAMCGEAGETANVVKKLRRAELNLEGALDPLVPVLLEKLADELADTITYADLVAAYYDIDLGEAVRAKFNKVSERESLPERL